MSREALEVLIRKAMTDKLRGIVTGRGYLTDLGDGVLDEPVEDELINHTMFPCAYVFAGDEAPADGCSGGEQGSVWAFHVAAFGIAPDGDIDDVLARIKADIKKAVLTDEQLGLTTADLPTGSCLNGTEWAGAKKSLDVLAIKGSGCVVVRFAVYAEWSPSAA